MKPSKKFWNQLPVPLSKKLRALERRLLPQQLDAVIEELCAWRSLGLRELAGALNRSPVYLQNTAIKRLLKSGRIQFLFPSRPNHPRQAYRAPAANLPAVPSAVPTPYKTAASADRPVTGTTVDIGQND